MENEKSRVSSSAGDLPGRREGAIFFSTPPPPLEASVNTRVLREREAGDPLLTPEFVYASVSAPLGRNERGVVAFNGFAIPFLARTRMLR